MTTTQRKPRPRELGIPFGVLKTGPNNAITDVEGVLVGQVTLSDDAKGMHTGVNTRCLPASFSVTPSARWWAIPKLKNSATLKRRSY